MVNKASAGDCYSFKTPVWVLRKARDSTTVIHIPTIFTSKILAKSASGEAFIWTHMPITLGVVIIVMHTEKKGVESRPRTLGQWGYC
jgi:hypothetical protein